MEPCNEITSYVMWTLRHVLTTCILSTVVDSNATGTPEDVRPDSLWLRCLVRYADCWHVSEMCYEKYSYIMHLCHGTTRFWMVPGNLTVPSRTLIDTHICNIYACKFAISKDIHIQLFWRLYLLLYWTQFS